MRTLALSLLVACFNTSTAAQETARTVKMGDTIYAKYNFATVIKVPGDLVDDFVFGDKHGWSFSGKKEKGGGTHVCYIVPLRKKSKAWSGETNIHLVTRSGVDLDFNLIEIEGGRFDPQVVVKDEDPPKPERVSECDTGLKVQLTEAKLVSDAKQSQIERLNLDLQGKVDPAEFVASVHDNYSIPRKLRSEPFKVSRIYSRDNGQGAFTYIRSKAKHQPAFFERDGKEKRHVNYSYRDGVYTIPGEVTEGCLKIGKHEGCFKQKG